MHLFEKIYQKAQIKTTDVILEEVVNGFAKLCLAINQYQHFFRESEIEGQTRTRETAAGDGLKANIRQWTDYVQARIDELKKQYKKPFNIKESIKRTREINYYFYLINAIKNDILSDSVIEANNVIKSPESNEIYRQCFVYINLIGELNGIIVNHNKYFESINRPDQQIALVWSDF
jgi:hypothetical protein